VIRVEYERKGTMGTDAPRASRGTRRQAAVNVAPVLEIIVQTVDEALSAQEGGATQLDLKSDFVEHGLTPTAGMVERICSRVNIDVIVMVRTHANGMLLTPDDLAVMCTDIRLAAERGARGFLLGALTPGGRIDRRAVEILQDASGDLPLHFHLAWELTRDPGEALEELIELGIRSVRTTGGYGLNGKALSGRGRIRDFREQARGRIDLLLAGGVSAKNIALLVRETGVQNAHAGSSVRHPPNHKGVVVVSKVRQLREALDRALNGP
jgi:copper homeostasis protein